MATGDTFSYTTGYNAHRAVQFFTGLAATNGQPTAATDGVPCYMSRTVKNKDNGVCYNVDAAREATIVLKGTGTGTVTGTFRLWGYVEPLAEWIPVGTGADTTKGTINTGAAIGETKSDKVLHAEPFLYVGHFDRLYLECTAIGGTSPSFEAWIITPRPSPAR